ncbi:STAS domain-containing protein [Actinocrispum sp. NPDC049592]|uniref:STAS domain-containing protein n=1 Tax=Actinocrispum sp. NPDC049592 TaxID=3154835 RepID=UPI0034396B63
MADKLLKVEVHALATGVPVVKVLGDLDLATAPAFKQAMTEQATHGREFVVDMDGVDFLSSAGLAVLVDLRQQMDDQNLKWAVVAARHTVTRPLEITGLHAVLPIFTDIPAALNSLTG